MGHFKHEFHFVKDKVVYGALNFEKIDTNEILAHNFIKRLRHGSTFIPILETMP